MSSSGLRLKVFETTIKKIKEENHGLVVNDNLSDLENTPDYNCDEYSLERLNKICEIDNSSNECQNNENIPNVPELNAQVLGNANLCVSRLTKNEKMSLHLSSDQSFETISTASKTIHKCSEYCSWCFYFSEKFNHHVGEIKKIEIRNYLIESYSLKTDSCLCECCFSLLQNIHLKNTDGIDNDEGLITKNVQKSNYPYEQNKCLKAKKMKMVCSCAVINCDQESTEKLSENLSKIIKKIFSKYHFSFKIRPISFSTSNEGNKKSSLAFCEEHQRKVNIITSCQLCSNQVERYDFKDCKIYDDWNSILKNNKILLTLQPGMFICLTCKSCITDNDFLSPVNLKCLQENVEKKNNERRQTFLHSSLKKINFASPEVTSIRYFEYDSTIEEMKNYKETQNYEFNPNKRTYQMTNSLKNEGRTFKLRIINCDTSSSKHHNHIESEKEIDRTEYNEKVTKKASGHHEELKTKPETFAKNNKCMNEKLASLNVEDFIIEYNNEEIGQSSNVYKNRNKRFLLPIISNVISQQDSLNVDESNICIDLVNDSDSSDLDEEPSILENSNKSENVFSQQGLLNVDESNIIIDLLQDSEDSDDGQSNNTISNKPDRNKYRKIINVAPVRSDHAKSQIRSHHLKLNNKLHNYSINDNTTELCKNKNNSVSDYIDVENVYSEKNEELSMLRNTSDAQDYSGEKVKELFMIQSNTEEQYIISSDDDDDVRMFMSVNHLEKVSSANKPGLHNNLESTLSPSPDHASPLRFRRTLQKVPDFYNYSRPELNINLTKSTNKNVESETKPLKDKCRNLSILKNMRSPSKTYEIDEIWNKAVSAFTDQLNDPNNPNEKVLEDLVRRMNGNTLDILNYLMENQQKLCNGELIVSENADPNEVKYLKKHLKGLINDECYSDKDVSVTLSSSLPLSMCTKLTSHEVHQKMSAPKNIISTDFNLSDDHNSLDTTTLTTTLSKLIPSSKIFDHSLVDSQKTTTSKSNGNFYPLFANKKYSVELIPISQPKPSVSHQLKPKPLLFVKKNPTNPKYILVKKPNY